MKYVFILVGVIGFFSFTCFGQEVFPEVGKPMPNYTFNDIVQYPKKTASITDFRGKWLIIDFWSVYCSSCLKGMPKMNELQKKFKDKIKVLMVGSTAPLGTANDVFLVDKTKRTWEYMSKLHKLKLSNAFDNSLFNTWESDGILGLPICISVDPNGIVRSISGTLKENDIISLINGKDPEAKHVYLPVNKNDVRRTFKVTFFPDSDLLGKNDSSFLFRSLITKYTSKIGAPHYYFTKEGNKRAQIQICGKLSGLYYYAYSGKMDFTQLLPDIQIGKDNLSKVPILKLKDSSLFFDIKMPNERMEGSKNIFCYSLSVNPGEMKDQSDLRKIMQRDLATYFNHNIEIKKQMIPVKYLIVSDNKKAKKLRTKGGMLYGYDESQKLSRYLSVSFKNVPISYVVNRFIYCLPKLPSNPGIGGSEFSEYVLPIVDKTGIQWNIDIDLTGDMSSFQDLKNNINKYGLDIIDGEIEASVMVISEALPL